MAYESVDKLQNALGERVFHYTQDRKKAAGRALGTMIEIITFYLLKSWGFNNSTSIERGLAEYGNEEIIHNVEYSLHPINSQRKIYLPNDGNSLTANKILKGINDEDFTKNFVRKNNTLLDKHSILRNGCTIGISDEYYLITSINSTGENYEISVFEQHKSPYAIF